MPVFIDILENKVLGREYKRGLQEGRVEGKLEGRQEGLEEGRQEGLVEGQRKGEMALLRSMIETRFGVLPAWADERLASRSTAELEEIPVRLMKAESLDDLLN